MFNKRDVEKQSIQTFGYELDMLNRMGEKLISGVDDVVVRNALIEAFLLHARALIDFFSGKKIKRDDLTCSDFYKEDGTPFAVISVQLPDDFREKLNKHVMHPTFTRNSESVEWEVNKVRSELNAAAIRFIQECSPEHFGSAEHKTKVIENMKSIQV